MDIVLYVKILRISSSNMILQINRILMLLILIIRLNLMVFLGEVLENIEKHYQQRGLT